jgi:hypothetical protein
MSDRGTTCSTVLVLGSLVWSSDVTGDVRLVLTPAARAATAIVAAWGGALSSVGHGGGSQGAAGFGRSKRGRTCGRRSDGFLGQSYLVFAAGVAARAGRGINCQRGGGLRGAPERVCIPAVWRGGRGGRGCGGGCLGRKWRRSPRAAQPETSGPDHVPSGARRCSSRPLAENSLPDDNATHLPASRHPHAIA